MLGKGKRQIYIKHKMSSCFKSMSFKRVSPQYNLQPATTLYSILQKKLCIYLLYQLLNVVVLPSSFYVPRTAVSFSVFKLYISDGILSSSYTQARPNIQYVLKVKQQLHKCCLYMYQLHRISLKRVILKLVLVGSLGATHKRKGVTLSRWPQVNFYISNKTDILSWFQLQKYSLQF